MTAEIKKRIEQIQRGKVAKGYKKAGRYIIPNHWGLKRLSDFGIWVGGGTPAKDQKEYWENGTIDWISSQEVKNRTLSGTTYQITEKALQASSSTLIPPNSLVIVTRSGILRHSFPVAKTTKCMAINQDIKALILNNPIEIDFIVKSLEYCEIDILKTYTKKGTTVESIIFDAFSKYIIPYMPKEERIKIVNILTTQDHLIELKEKLIVEKQRQKKYLMQQLLTGKKRLFGFSGKWGTVELNKLAKKQKEKNTEFKYSLVLSNSAQNGIVPQDEQFDKEIANTDKINGYYIVKNGDFVYNPRISVTAPCGPINMNRTGKIGVMSPLYTVFSIQSSKIDHEFIKQYFKSTCWFRHMKSVANYGARHDRMSVTDEDFFSMPIPLPELAEQRTISQALSTADREIELLQKDLEAEKQKKKALMHLLLTGIVRVNV